MYTVYIHIYVHSMKRYSLSIHKYIYIYIHSLDRSREFSLKNVMNIDSNILFL